MKQIYISFSLLWNFRRIDCAIMTPMDFEMQENCFPFQRSRAGPARSESEDMDSSQDQADVSSSLLMLDEILVERNLVHSFEI